MAALSTNRRTNHTAASKLCRRRSNNDSSDRTPGRKFPTTSSREVGLFHWSHRELQYESNSCSSPESRLLSLDPPPPNRSRPRLGLEPDRRGEEGCRARGFVPRRSSPSCGRPTCCSGRARRWRRWSRRSGSARSQLRDELLDREIFHSLPEAQVLIEAWRRHYDAVRPHSALGYRPPAPETVLWPAWLSPRPTAGDRADVVYH